MIAQMFLYRTKRRRSKEDLEHLRLSSCIVRGSESLASHLYSRLILSLVTTLSDAPVYKRIRRQLRNLFAGRPYTLASGAKWPE